jgi:hypothetical protein
MNPEYSKISIDEKQPDKARYKSLTKWDGWNLSICDIQLENSSSWDNDEYPKSNDKIKNFITFLKLIDERMKQVKV